LDGGGVACRKLRTGHLGLEALPSIASAWRNRLSLGRAVELLDDGAVTCLVGERLCSGLDADGAAGLLAVCCEPCQTLRRGERFLAGAAATSLASNTTMSFSPETLTVVCQDALDKLQKIRKEVLRMPCDDAARRCPTPPPWSPPPPL